MWNKQEINGHNTSELKVLFLGKSSTVWQQTKAAIKQLLAQMKQRTNPLFSLQTRQTVPLLFVILNRRTGGLTKRVKKMLFATLKVSLQRAVASCDTAV